MVGSNAATQDSSKQIAYYDCQLVKWYKYLIGGWNAY
jgi:hypothetical protein